MRPCPARPSAHAIIASLAIVALHHVRQLNALCAIDHTAIRSSVLGRVIISPTSASRSDGYCINNAAFCSPSSCFRGRENSLLHRRTRSVCSTARQGSSSDEDESSHRHDNMNKGEHGHEIEMENSVIADRVRARAMDLVGDTGATDTINQRGRRLKLGNTARESKNDETKNGSAEVGIKARLARATASLIAKRKKEESTKNKDHNPSELSFSSSAETNNDDYRDEYSNPDEKDTTSFNLINLTKKIDQKILANNWNRSGQPRRVNDKTPGGRKGVHVQHETDSIQSLLGYNHFEGEWSDRNSTTYHVAIVFGKPLIRDQVTVEYATRLRTLAKMLKEERPSYRPSLICFTGGVSSGENSISDASAGYVYFRHLCASQNIDIDESRTKFWVDGKSSNDVREAMDGIASELWRNYIKVWLKDRPMTERLNQHYGVGWTILERKVDIHFTLVSTEYHLCNLNDVHHRSPGKSFLQPLVSLRGLVGSDRWVNKDELEAMTPNYSSSVHVSNANGDGGGPSGGANSLSDQANFGGIENSVDTSWSFQYGTYPFLHKEEDAIVFLGQCFLLGEELTPLLINMRGVVEQTEFFQRDNYLLLSSIRRSLVSLVEALYTDKGQEIRAGVIKYFEESRGRNQCTKEDVKIIVMLESALLNLGRCIDLVKPAGLLVSSVPAATWSKALRNLEESMSRIKTVCDPDQPLDALQWGKLVDDGGCTSDDSV